MSFLGCEKGGRGKRKGRKRGRNLGDYKMHKILASLSSHMLSIPSASGDA